MIFLFSSRRRHTRFDCDWSSDVCSSDLAWRKSYADWPALHKLRAVDELVASVRGVRPPVRNRTRIEPLEHNTRTLAQHYRRKLARNRQIRRGLADELLRRAFSPERSRPDRPRA